MIDMMCILFVFFVMVVFLVVEGIFNGWIFIGDWNVVLIILNMGLVLVIMVLGLNL